MAAALPSTNELLSAFRLDERGAVVTGGASGVGAAIAEVLAAGAERWRGIQMSVFENRQLEAIR